MVLDIIILIPLIWAAFKGFRNGLVKEVFSLLALVGGVYLAYYLSDVVAAKLPFASTKLAAFAVVFICVVILAFVVGGLVEKIIRVVVPKILDRLCGVVFGALKVWLICAIAIGFVQNVDKKEVFINKKSMGSSKLYPYVDKTIDIWEARGSKGSKA